MRTYFFVLKEDDAWWMRVRGKTHGGFLTRDIAIRQAIGSASKCTGAAVVAAEQPNGQFRIEWTNEPAALAEEILVGTENRPQA